MENDSAKKDNLILLRIFALGALMAGAAGSLVFTLHAGRHNNSVLLVTLFTGWVLSPFIALMATHIASKQWSYFASITLYIVMLLITFGSLAGYSGLLSPVGSKPAGTFLIVPLLSWLIMTIVYFVIRLKKTK